MRVHIPEKLKDEKWDLRKGQVIYSSVYTHRLVQWIRTGRVKKGEVAVWRGGLSGWVRPETLSELTPYFQEWELSEKRKQERKRPVRGKKVVKSILVIDDEEDTCSLLRRLLESKYEISAVTSGRAGIGFVKRKRPDLALLDLKLRDMDGLAVLSRIGKISPRTTVIMISAYGDEDIKREARRLGAFVFIDKPLFAKKVFGAIRKVGR